MKTRDRPIHRQEGPLASICLVTEKCQREHKMSIPFAGAHEESTTITRMAAMRTHSRMLRAPDLGSAPQSRRVGEYQAQPVRLVGAEAASTALKKGYSALAVVLALSSSLVHAQTRTCAAPRCNSGPSDGNGNTAMGTQALVNAIVTPPSEAYRNTASGAVALYSNPSGSYNTASGVYALTYNTTGDNNTAVGFEALTLNTTGVNNTASGNNALYSNKQGYNNTATASDALKFNNIGYDNTASGVAALYSNTIGNYNEASGHDALYFNTSGAGNGAIGQAALFFNTTGSYKVAVGYAAGYNQTTGSSNIYISHRGVAAESGVIRVGTPGTQTETYIAGVENVKITGEAVYVTSSGQLGVLASSERPCVGMSIVDGWAGTG
jgi:hypothetical protein